MRMPVQGKFRRQRLSLMILLLATADVSAEAVDNLLSLSLEELSEISVSIATGSPKSITGAPAGTTLITANDIYIMGAQTLEGEEKERNEENKIKGRQVCGCERGRHEKYQINTCIIR